MSLPAANGPAANGPAANGPAANGPAANGPAANGPATSLLRVQRLSAAFGDRRVLRNVSFNAEPGEFIGLIGPNGAGKSTLLKAALGLMPSQGAITVAGRDVRQLRPHARAGLMAYLPQERDIAWGLTARAVVMLGRTPYRAPMRPPTAADAHAVNAAMAQTGITHLRDRSVAEMSGGERSRTLIARALAQEGPLLLADEPVAGLDPAHQIAVMELFADLADQGRTVIVTLHELHLAARWCRRILILHDGALVADGPPAAVLTQQRLAQVYGVETYRAESPHGLIVMPVARLAGEDHEPLTPRA